MAHNPEKTRLPLSSRKSGIPQVTPAASNIPKTQIRKESGLPFRKQTAAKAQTSKVKPSGEIKYGTKGKSGEPPPETPPTTPTTSKKFLSGIPNIFSKLRGTQSKGSMSVKAHKTDDASQLAKVRKAGSFEEHRTESATGPPLPARNRPSSDGSNRLKHFDDPTRETVSRGPNKNYGNVVQDHTSDSSNGIYAVPSNVYVSRKSATPNSPTVSRSSKLKQPSSKISPPQYAGKSNIQSKLARPGDQGKLVSPYAQGLLYAPPEKKINVEQVRKSSEKQSSDIPKMYQGPSTSNTQGHEQLHKHYTTPGNPVSAISNYSGSNTDSITSQDNSKSSPDVMPKQLPVFSKSSSFVRPSYGYGSPSCGIRMAEIRASKRGVRSASSSSTSLANSSRGASPITSCSDSHSEGQSSANASLEKDKRRDSGKTYSTFGKCASDSPVPVSSQQSPVYYEYEVPQITDSITEDNKCQNIDSKPIKQDVLETHFNVTDTAPSNKLSSNGKVHDSYSSEQYSQHKQGNYANSPSLTLPNEANVTDKINDVSANLELPGECDKSESNNAGVISRESDLVTIVKQRTADKITCLNPDSELFIRNQRDHTEVPQPQTASPLITLTDGQSLASTGISGLSGMVNDENKHSSSTNANKETTNINTTLLSEKHKKVTVPGTERVKMDTSSRNSDSHSRKITAMDLSESGHISVNSHDLVSGTDMSLLPTLHELANRSIPTCQISGNITDTNINIHQDPSLETRETQDKGSVKIKQVKSGDNCDLGEALNLTLSDNKAIGITDNCQGGNHPAEPKQKVIPGISDCTGVPHVQEFNNVNTSSAPTDQVPISSDIVGLSGVPSQAHITKSVQKVRLNSKQRPASGLKQPSKSSKLKYTNIKANVGTQSKNNTNQCTSVNRDDVMEADQRAVMSIQDSVGKPAPLSEPVSETDHQLSAHDRHPSQSVNRENTDNQNNNEAGAAGIPGGEVAHGNHISPLDLSFNGNKHAKITHSVKGKADKTKASKEKKDQCTQTNKKTIVRHTFVKGKSNISPSRHSKSPPTSPTVTVGDHQELMSDLCQSRGFNEKSEHDIGNSTICSPQSGIQQSSNNTETPIEGNNEKPPQCKHNEVQLPIDPAICDPTTSKGHVVSQVDSFGACDEYKEKTNIEMCDKGLSVDTPVTQKQLGTYNDISVSVDNTSRDVIQMNGNVGAKIQGQPSASKIVKDIKTKRLGQSGITPPKQHNKSKSTDKSVKKGMQVPSTKSLSRDNSGSTSSLNSTGSGVSNGNDKKRFTQPCKSITGKPHMESLNNYSNKSSRNNSGLNNVTSDISGSNGAIPRNKPTLMRYGSTTGKTTKIRSTKEAPSECDMNTKSDSTCGDIEKRSSYPGTSTSCNNEAASLTKDCLSSATQQHKDKSHKDQQNSRHAFLDESSKGCDKKTQDTRIKSNMAQNYSNGKGMSSGSNTGLLRNQGANRGYFGLPRPSNSTRKTDGNLQSVSAVNLCYQYAYQYDNTDSSDEDQAKGSSISLKSAPSGLPHNRFIPRNITEKLSESKSGSKKSLLSRSNVMAHDRHQQEIHKSEEKLKFSKQKDSFGRKPGQGVTYKSKDSAVKKFTHSKSGSSKLHQAQPTKISSGKAEIIDLNESNPGDKAFHGESKIAGIKSGKLSQADGSKVKTSQSAISKNRESGLKPKRTIPQRKNNYGSKNNTDKSARSLIDRNSGNNSSDKPAKDESGKQAQKYTQLARPSSAKKEEIVNLYSGKSSIPSSLSKPNGGLLWTGQKLNIRDRLPLSETDESLPSSESSDDTVTMSDGGLGSDEDDLIDNTGTLVGSSHTTNVLRSGGKIEVMQKYLSQGDQYGNPSVKSDSKIPPNMAKRLHSDVSASRNDKRGGALTMETGNIIFEEDEDILVAGGGKVEVVFAPGVTQEKRSSINQYYSHNSDSSLSPIHSNFSDSGVSSSHFDSLRSTSSVLSQGTIRAYNFKANSPEHVVDYSESDTVVSDATVEYYGHDKKYITSKFSRDTPSPASLRQDTPSPICEKTELKPPVTETDIDQACSKELHIKIDNEPAIVKDMPQIRDSLEPLSAQSENNLTTPCSQDDNNGKLLTASNDMVITSENTLAVNNEKKPSTNIETRVDTMKNEILNDSTSSSDSLDVKPNLSVIPSLGSRPSSANEASVENLTLDLPNDGKSNKSHSSPDLGSDKSSKNSEKSQGLRRAVATSTLNKLENNGSKEETLRVLVNSGVGDRVQTLECTNREESTVFCDGYVNKEQNRCPKESVPLNGEVSEHDRESKQSENPQYVENTRFTTEQVVTDRPVTCVKTCDVLSNQGESPKTSGTVNTQETLIPGENYVIIGSLGKENLKQEINQEHLEGNLTSCTQSEGNINLETSGIECDVECKNPKVSNAFQSGCNKHDSCQMGSLVDCGRERDQSGILVSNMQVCNDRPFSSKSEGCTTDANVINNIDLVTGEAGNATSTDDITAINEPSGNLIPAVTFNGNDNECNKLEHTVYSSGQQSGQNLLDCEAPTEPQNLIGGVSTDRFCAINTTDTPSFRDLPIPTEGDNVCNDSLEDIYIDKCYSSDDSYTMEEIERSNELGKKGYMKVVSDSESQLDSSFDVEFEYPGSFKHVQVHSNGQVIEKSIPHIQVDPSISKEPENSPDKSEKNNNQEAIDKLVNEITDYQWTSDSVGPETSTSCEILSDLDIKDIKSPQLNKDCDLQQNVPTVSDQDLNPLELNVQPTSHHSVTPEESNVSFGDRSDETRISNKRMDSDPQGEVLPHENKPIHLKNDLCNIQSLETENIEQSTIGANLQDSISQYQAIDPNRITPGKSVNVDTSSAFERLFGARKFPGRTINPATFTWQAASREIRRAQSLPANRVQNAIQRLSLVEEIEEERFMYGSSPQRSVTQGDHSDDLRSGEVMEGQGLRPPSRAYSVDEGMSYYGYSYAQVGPVNLHWKNNL